MGNRLHVFAEMVQEELTGQSERQSPATPTPTARP